MNVLKKSNNNMKLNKIIIAVTLFFTIYNNLSAANNSILNSEKLKSFNAGIAFNSEMVSLEVEYNLQFGLGFRYIGIYVFGLGLNENEFIITNVLTLIYNFNINGTIMPVIFFGINYSFHKWYISSFETTGNIHDFTFGGGFGLCFKIKNTLIIGINLWINYDYKIKQNFNQIVKSDRFLLFIPFLDIKFYF